MTVTRRARMTPQQRRAQLIELGKEMLSTRSIEELSIEELADQAGISRGLLFHYFGSKQEFHLAVATAAADDVLTVTEPDNSLPPVERLTEAMTKMVDSVIDKPDAYISLVRGSASGDAEMRDLFERTRDVQAARISEVMPEYGVALTPKLTFAIHGWVAFAEETIVRWLRSRREPVGANVGSANASSAGVDSTAVGVVAGSPVSREELIELLSGSLTAIVLFAAGVVAV